MLFIINADCHISPFICNIILTPNFSILLHSSTILNDTGTLFFAHKSSCVDFERIFEYFLLICKHQTECEWNDRRSRRVFPCFY